MDLTRNIALDLQMRGEIDILQKGEVLPIGSRMKGPIRLRCCIPGATVKKKDELPIK